MGAAALGAGAEAVAAAGASGVGSANIERM